MSTPEAPRPLSNEEFALRDDLEQVIRGHYLDGDFVIVQDDDIYEPAEVVFAGKLRSEKPGQMVDVEVTDILFGRGDRVTTLAIGHDNEYQLDKDGIVATHNREFHLDQAGLRRLRFWVRETKWAREHTQAMVQRKERQT